MEKTLLSTTVRKSWTAQHEGWNLTFTLEQGNSTTVFCNGIKQGETQPAPPAPNYSASLNAQLNPANNASSLNFNGISHDSVLASVIMAEMEAILAEEVV